MKKIFSFIVGLLCAVGTTYADNVTLGRTIELDANKTDYTLNSYKVGTETLADVTLADGTGKTMTGKAVNHGADKATMACTCYRDKDAANVNLTKYDDNSYAGFKVTLTEGYKIDLSQLDLKTAANANFSYRVAIIDKDGKAVYTSSDYTMSDFNKASAKNQDLTIKFEETETMTGDFDVRLYYWNTGNSGSKYIVPLELTVTGNLAQDKAVASKTTSITGLTINGVSYNDLTSLNTNKKLEINEKYTEAPTLVFTKTTTTKYTDNTENSSSVDVTAVANKVDVDGIQKWLATTTIGEDVYEVYFFVDQTKELNVDVQSFNLVANKADIAIQAINVRAVNFSGDATVTVDSEVEGLSVPTTLTLTDGTDARLNVEYKSDKDVAEASANITISAEGLTVTIPFKYSSTAKIETIEDVTGDMAWDFTTAAKDAKADILSPRELECVALANKTGYSDSFNYAALKSQGKYFYRQSNKCWQGRYIIFNTTVPGTVVVTFTNTGSNQNRSIKINGTSANETGCTGTAVTTDEFNVLAGEVKIEGYNVSGDNAGTGADVRITNITFKASDATTTDITLSSAGMGTFSSTTAYSLPEGLTAYIAACDGSKVTLTKVEDGIVAANQGVVFSGEKNGKYTLTPTTTGSTTDWTKNELKNTASAVYTTADGDQSTYVLIANAAGNGQFARLNGGETIPVGKAYLTVDGNDAKTLSLNFGGDTNSINAVENNAELDGAYYTLSGQKTVKPVKGLYIHNGKKYIAK